MKIPKFPAFIYGNDHKESGYQSFNEGIPDPHGRKIIVGVYTLTGYMEVDGEPKQKLLSVEPGSVK
jgi:hypothetical protein